MRIAVIVGVVVGMIGCGEVEPVEQVDAAGGSTGQAGRGGTTGTAGQSGSSGQAGSTGAAGNAGTGGTPLKPLGATCTTGSECDGPHICAASAGGMVCCDGHPDACNTCASGHLQPVPDGTLCGTQPSGITCTGPYTISPGPINVYSSAQSMACTAGACALTTVSCSMLSCPSGQHGACRVDILSSGVAQMEGTGCGCYM